MSHATATRSPPQPTRTIQSNSMTFQPQSNNLFMQQSQMNGQTNMAMSPRFYYPPPPPAAMMMPNPPFLTQMQQQQYQMIQQHTQQIQYQLMNAAAYMQQMANQPVPPLPPMPPTNQSKVVSPPSTQRRKTNENASNNSGRRTLFEQMTAPIKLTKQRRKTGPLTSKIVVVSGATRFEEAKEQQHPSPFSPPAKRPLMRDLSPVLNQTRAQTMAVVSPPSSPPMRSQRLDDSPLLPPSSQPSSPMISGKVEPDSTSQPSPPLMPLPPGPMSTNSPPSQRSSRKQHTSLKTAYLNVAGSNKGQWPSVGRRSSLAASESLHAGVPVELVTNLNAAGLVSPIFSSNLPPPNTDNQFYEQPLASSRRSDSEYGVPPTSARPHPPNHTTSTPTPRMSKSPYSPSLAQLHVFPWCLSNLTERLPKSDEPAADLKQMNLARFQSAPVTSTSEETSFTGSTSSRKSLVRNRSLVAPKNKPNESTDEVVSPHKRRLSFMITDPDNVARELSTETIDTEAENAQLALALSNAQQSQASPSKPKSGASSTSSSPPTSKRSSTTSSPSSSMKKLTTETSPTPSPKVTRDKSRIPGRRTTTVNLVTDKTALTPKSPEKDKEKDKVVETESKTVAKNNNNRDSLEKDETKPPLLPSPSTTDSITAPAAERIPSALTDSMNNRGSMTNLNNRSSMTSLTNGVNPSRSSLTASTSDDNSGIIYLTYEEVKVEKKVFTIDAAKIAKEKAEKAEKERARLARQQERDRKKMDELEEKKAKQLAAEQAKEQARLARERMKQVMNEQIVAKRKREAAEKAEKEKQAQQELTAAQQKQRALEQEARNKAAQEMNPDFDGDEDAFEAEGADPAFAASTPSKRRSGGPLSPNSNLPLRKRAFSISAAAGEGGDLLALSTANTATNSADGSPAISPSVSTVDLTSPRRPPGLPRPPPANVPLTALSKTSLLDPTLHTKVPVSRKKSLRISPKVIAAAKRGDVDEMRSILMDEFGKVGPLPYSEKELQRTNKSGETRAEFLNRIDKNGSSALFHAVWPGHYAFMEFLLEQGANPDLQNMRRNSVMHLAVERGHEDVIRLLLRYGADPLLINQNQHAPFQVLPTNKEILQWASFLYLNLEAVWKTQYPGWEPEDQQVEEDNLPEADTNSTPHTRQASIEVGNASPQLQPQPPTTSPGEHIRTSSSPQPPPMADESSSSAAVVPLDDHNYQACVTLNELTPRWLAELSSIFMKKDVTRVHTKNLQTKVKSVMRMGLLKRLSGGSLAAITGVDGAKSPINSARSPTPPSDPSTVVSSGPYDPSTSPPRSKRTTLNLSGTTATSGVGSGRGTGLANLLANMKMSPSKGKHSFGSGRNSGRNSGKSSQRNSLEKATSARRFSQEVDQVNSTATTAAATATTPTAATSSPPPNKRSSGTTKRSSLGRRLTFAPVPMSTAAPVAAVKTASIFSESLKDLDSTPSTTFAPSFTKKSSIWNTPK